MTLETPPNPRHVALCDNLLRRLEALPKEPGEEVINVRVVVRAGIARKVKWTREEEECFP